MLNGAAIGIIALAGGFGLLSVISIALRCYTKIRIGKNFQLNDLGMITVVFTYFGLGALLVLGLENGIAGHTSAATPVTLREALKYIWFMEVIYVVLTSIMKASVAATLLQWAKTRLHKNLLWVAIVLDFLICSVVTFYIIFQCSPISYAWLQTDPTVKGKCQPFVIQLYMGYALCITTISIDMLFLIVPPFMLRGRGVNSRIKMCIYVLLAVGVAASVANFIRLAALVKLKSSLDPLFDAAPVFLWSVVEVSLGIIVAGILELGPLMRNYGVKGFEHYSTYATKLADDDDMEPLKLQIMNKGSGMVTTRRM